MKKIVYLAPALLLGLGVKASASQASTHISNALRMYENDQNQPIGKVEETTHISRLDTGLINEDSSVGSGQTSQVMQIGRAVIPTKQELSESKESVAGQYVQVQQNRVARFNKGSKIYGLTNSSQLSKNNGDGYVITNAGMYNGRAVDIGVVINHVQDKQGTYTAKWSNGDKADVTGKIDDNFKYENNVLPGQTAVQPNLNKTRSRTETKDITVNSYPDYWLIIRRGGGADTYFISPKLLQIVEKENNLSETEALKLITKDGASLNTDNIYNKKHYHKLDHNIFFTPVLANGSNGYYVPEEYTTGDFSSGLTVMHVEIIDPTKEDFLWTPYQYNDRGGRTYTLVAGKHYDPHAQPKTISDMLDIERRIRCIPFETRYSISENKGLKGYDFGLGITTVDKKKKVTQKVIDNLQVDKINQGSLNYNYQIGVYDAQTGDLIKDLTANYKGKAGKAATDQDTAMNDAVKAKIQAINADDADAAYTGTAASDDVAFSKNTVHVNYVNEQGQPINVPGYDIDVDNLTSGNYQVPQNYVLANANGFKVTKNTHEVNGVTVTDSYNFIDQGHNKVTDNGKTLSVVLTHGTTNVDVIHSGLSNDVTNNAFVINDGAKRQINSQSRHFGASGILDLVTNKITKQGDWQLSGKSNFDQVTINNNLVGYGNAIHSNLTFLAL